MISISEFKNILYTKCGYNAGDGVVVGLSGGADSMSLLHLMQCALDGSGDFIGAVHVNHGIRGDEAERDTVRAQCFCEKIGVPCKTVYRDIPAEARELHISEEDAGRRARYEEFSKAAEEWGAGCIAVAHNKNDQAETVLMNILRGSGLNGISGMSFRGRNIIRPLLDTERTEIERYCEENRLPFVFDSTNYEDVYARNKIRLKVLPYISEQTGKNAVRKLAELAAAAREDNDYISGEAEKLYKKVRLETGIHEKTAIDMKGLRGTHPSQIKRVILLAVAEIRGSIKDVGRKNLDDILKLIDDSGTGKTLTLPGGLRVETEYEKLLIYIDKGEVSDVQSDVKMDISLESFDFARIQTYKDMNRRPLANERMRQMCFDAEKVNALPGELCVRRRRNGDRIFLDRGAGSKKLKSYLIDMKIPREKRDELTLVAKGKTVLGILEIRAFGGFETDKSTKNVLILRF